MINFSESIIYEVRLDSFGRTFEGLVDRIPYLKTLGVDTVWLMPFLLSPRRDDGYDVSSFTEVDPAYGNFELFLQAAHSDGLNVVIDLPLNHTSTDHPWFQKDRQEGTDYYVWSDDPNSFSDARIIFSDYEDSNWSWDHQAQRFYWHRFYSHQPDLNYDNPEVVQHIRDAITHWFDLGVDGIRLDAVSFLYVKEGTDGESLPETHQFVKSIRRMVNQHYPDKALIVEACQSRIHAQEYMMGDEADGSFAFELAVELLKALATGNSVDLRDTLLWMDNVSGKCAWINFLRHHDELSLEKVDYDTRLTMMQSYATHPRDGLNMGIRRRLFPLLGHDDLKFRLLNGLLFTLPGVPMIYYGEEFGMDDDTSLPDRYGLRGAMDWATAEHQLSSSESRSGFVRNMIALRNNCPAFTKGEIEVNDSDIRMLSFTRRSGLQSITVIANLSNDNIKIEASGYDLLSGGFASGDMLPYEIRVLSDNMQELQVRTNGRRTLADGHLLVKEFPMGGRYGVREAEICEFLSDDITVKPIMKHVLRKKLHGLVFPYVDGTDAMEHLKRLKNLGLQTSEFSASIGEATAKMHVALEEMPGGAGVPRKLFAGVASRVHRVADLVSPELADTMRSVVAAMEQIEPSYVDLQIIHGDFHLEQILVTKEGLRVIDFDGEPMTPPDERMSKSHVAQDLAGMLRSFDYIGECEQEKREFLSEYRLQMFGNDSGWDPIRNLIDLFIFSRATYELAYEYEANRGLTEMVEKQIPTVSQTAIRACRALT